MVHTKQKFKLNLAIFIMLMLTNISASIASASGLEPPLKVVMESRLGMSSTDITPQSIYLIISDIAYVDYQGLKAIDTNNGKILWSKDWSAGVAYKDGILYAGRFLSSNIYALNASTGEEIWKKEYSELTKSDFPIKYNLIMYNDTLLITTNGQYIRDPAFDPSGNHKGHYVFDILAIDIQGNLKWYHNYIGNIDFERNLTVSSNIIVIPYSISSSDFTDIKNNLIAFNLTTGDTIWRISNISYEGSPFSHKDLFFINHLRENDNVYIQAISSVTGDTIWKKKVDDSYGKILTVKDNKLFVISEKIKILSLETGDILDEYSSIDANILNTFPLTISENIIYAVSTHPSYIYIIDLNTGELLWKGGKGGLSPYVYENRLYLIVYGKLYAYEHGIEDADKDPGYMHAILGMLLILAIFLIVKKYRTSNITFERKQKEK